MIRRNLPRHGYEDDYNGTYYRIHRTQFAYSKHSQVLRAVPGTIRCPSTITATWILHYTKENTRKTVTHSPHYIKKKNLKLQTVSDVVTMCEENRKINIEKNKSTFKAASFGTSGNPFELMTRKRSIPRRVLTVQLHQNWFPSCWGILYSSILPTLQENKWRLYGESENVLDWPERARSSVELC